MKAVLVREFGLPGRMGVEDVPDPSPGAHELVIAVEAIAVNFVDALVVQGKYQSLPTPPFVPGKLPVGRVLVAGEHATRFKVGDRVVTFVESGGYAEKVAVAENLCYLLPPTVSSTAAAALSLAHETAWFALRERARAARGETLLVLGATGAVGRAAVQLGRAFGLHVLAGITNRSKMGSMSRLGASDEVDLTQPNLRETLRECILEKTGGHGADIVLDLLGGDYFDAAIRSVAWCGRLVVVGFVSGRIPSLKVNYLLLKNIEVTGLQVSDYRKRRIASVHECYREIFDRVVHGEISLPDVTTFPLEDLPQMLAELVARRTSGRLVAVPSVFGNSHDD